MLKNIPKYRFIRPLIPPITAWSPYLEESYRIRWFSNFGPANALFESRIQERFGLERAAITASTCTAGLIAVLQALRVSGKVAMPSFTFAATANAVTQAGAQPVFGDCNADTLQMCPEALGELLDIHRDIGAVLAVRPFGFCGDFEEISKTCDSRGIAFLLDAAAALGGAQGRKRSHSIEVFSLHATKSFSVGEGGLILAPPALSQAIRRAENFGLENGAAIAPGSNAKLSEFHAAVGLAMLDCFDDALKNRRRVAQRYFDVLSKSRNVAQMWMHVPSPWPTFPVLLAPTVDADDVVRRAAMADVELRRYYTPLHSMKQFRDVPSGQLSATEALASRMICLPVYADMSAEEQDDIIDRLSPVFEI